MPQKIAARLKSAETMETAWTRLDAWFGHWGLFINDLMQDIKNVPPIKYRDDERMMDYYVMLQSHIAEACNVADPSQRGDDGVPIHQLREKGLERDSGHAACRGQGRIHGNIRGGEAEVRHQHGGHKRAARAAQTNFSA